MEKLSMAALNRDTISTFKEKTKTPVVLVLDNIRSGLNVGSIFRTADAFALEKVVLCGITAQPPHREILKTALGSTESVDWMYVENTTDAVNQLVNQGYEVFAVEQTTGSTMLDTFLPAHETRYAFVLGNEVDGVDEIVLPLCNGGALEIPQFGTKHSLNVAVATGIVVWQVVKAIKAGADTGS